MKRLNDDIDVQELLKREWFIEGDHYATKEEFYYWCIPNWKIMHLTEYKDPFGWGLLEDISIDPSDMKKLEQHLLHTYGKCK